MTTCSPEPKGQLTSASKIATAINSTAVQSRRILPHAGGEHEDTDDEEGRHPAPTVQSNRILPHAGGDKDKDDERDRRHAPSVIQKDSSARRRGP